MNIHVHTYIHIYMYTHIYTLIYAYTYMYAFIYIYIYMYKEGPITCFCVRNIHDISVVKLQAGLGHEQKHVTGGKQDRQ